MKFTLLLLVLLLAGCAQRQEELSAERKEQIKHEIIKLSEKHASDLENLDFESAMTFYAKTPEFIVFGDGYYWGDYQTIEGVWREILGEGGWKKMLKWDLQNHKVYVQSENAVSYLVEFDHLHLSAEGDTVGSSGCFSYGMQKIDGEWKTVTAHVTHIPFRTNEPKWWERHSPSGREKKQN